MVPLLERIQADESVPILARELFAAEAEEYARLQEQIDEVDAELMAWHNQWRGTKTPTLLDRARLIPLFPDQVMVGMF